MTPNKEPMPIPVSLWLALRRWFDSEATSDHLDGIPEKRIDWFRILPFLVLHVMCLGVLWVGWSTTAIYTALALYIVRMFAITGFYHRYFSHKTFKTNRFWQFVFAVMGNAAVQRGPLWWAAHHRHHHRFTDTKEDVHSPVQHGFWWSHMGWLTNQANFLTKKRYIQEWLKFPELRFLNRFDNLIPILLAVGLFFSGQWLSRNLPQLDTNGMQLLIWGFFISSTVLFHATVTINSLAHMWGSRRYNTSDASRNNFVLSILTLGEGWHNNHHHYPISARQGFFWWELDVTYYGLVLLSKAGIIRDLRPLPAKVKAKNRVSNVPLSEERS
jgi:stearoyl-CoA desaturase (delta-9 desaturase)